MKCAWQELLSVLPPWLARESEKYGQTVQELRLRLGRYPQLVCREGSVWLRRQVTQEDLNFSVNTASRYSPWASQSAARGYITAPGGHRIGLCGEAVVQNGEVTGFRRVTSLNIRVARDFPGIAADCSRLRGSILVLGPPGSGKTTLLRDLIRQVSRTEAVAVVDEREELFPQGCFEQGEAVDVLSGSPKTAGIEMVLRTMGPACIAVDEITAQEDCEALLRAGWCGVRLLATAHAASRKDLSQRPLYRPLLETQLFEHILVLGRDKSWHEERMDL